MKKRTVLYAEEGKILTNGTVYGTVIFLAEDQSAFSFYEITKEEYEKMIKEQLSQGGEKNEFTSMLLNQ